MAMTYLAQPVEEERQVGVVIQVLGPDVPLEPIAARAVQHGDGEVGAVVVLPEERRLERAHREGA